MVRFKLIHKGLKLLPVDFDRQVIKREAHKLERLQTEAQQLRDFLKRHTEDRKGS